MSCLCIHLVTLFNLPCKNIFVMEQIILCNKTSFLWHAPSSQSVYFGEITRVMRHICIFSRDIFSPQFFPDVIADYLLECSFWLVVESISI